MANIILSPNMNLPVPIVGQEPGPQFATDINNSLTIVDQHNHTAGSGVQIPSSGININADLPFNSNNATLLRSSRYVSQGSVLSLPADVQCVYVSGIDLYYNDSNGTQIRLTQSGAVAGTPGSIANLVAPASASYNSGSSTFVFQAGANVAGNIDGASFILRNSTASSKGLTLAPPNAMANDYTIVLPALPGSTTSFVTLTTSGNMGAAISTNGGITSSNIASGTITGSNIASATITGSNIAAGTITGTNIAAAGIDRSNLPAVNSFTSAATTAAITSGSYQAIANFITTPTFSGKAVMVGITPAAGVANTSVNLISTGVQAIGFLGLFIDNVFYSQIKFGPVINGSGAMDLSFSPGSFTMLIPAGIITAGSHQVDIRGLIAAGSSLNIINCSMYLYELMGS